MDQLKLLVSWREHPVADTIRRPHQHTPYNVTILPEIGCGNPGSLFPVLFSPLSALGDTAHQICYHIWVFFNQTFMYHKCTGYKIRPDIFHMIENTALTA